MIVEFEAFLALGPFGVTPSFRADASTHHRCFESIVGGTEDLAEGGIIPFGKGIVEERGEGASGEIGGGGKSGEVDDGGVDVDELHDAGARLASSLESRGADDEWSAGALFEHGSFLPDAIVFTEVVAVVAPEDDDGVIGELETVEFIEHTAHLGIDKRDAGIVGLQGLAAVEFIDVVIWNGVVVGKSCRGNVVSITVGSVGEADLFERIHVEVFLRSNEGGVGAKKSGGDEKGIVLLFVHHLDRFGGDHSISLFFVGAFGSEPAEGAADFTGGLGVKNEVFVCLVAADWVHGALPGWRVVEAIGADAGGDVVVVDFSDAGNEVVFRDKPLRQGDGVRHGIAEVGIEIVNLDFIGSETGHHRGSAGIAEGELVVGAVEANTACGESVDVGSFGDEISVATERGGEVIDRDEEDVGFAGEGGSRQEERQR